MFRQTPRIEDISHGGVWPRRRMTDISGKVNWLCVFCLLSAGHLSSAALISGAGPDVESWLTWQACCLALLLDVLWLAGTHLFRVSSTNLLCSPSHLRSAVCRCCCLPRRTLLVHLRSRHPASTTLWCSFSRAGNMFWSKGWLTSLSSVTSYIIFSPFFFFFFFAFKSC